MHLDSDALMCLHVAVIKQAQGMHTEQNCSFVAECLNSSEYIYFLPHSVPGYSLLNLIK